MSEHLVILPKEYNEGLIFLCDGNANLPSLISLSKVKVFKNCHKTSLHEYRPW